MTWAHFGVPHAITSAASIRPRDSQSENRAPERLRTLGAVLPETVS
jgi:hypothetical protein